MDLLKLDNNEAIAIWELAMVDGVGDLFIMLKDDVVKKEASDDGPWFL